jgi:hypothetical protein
MFSFISPDVLQESITHIFRVVDTEVMRWKKMLHINTHLNQLSHPKMQATLPSETLEETKHSTVWCKNLENRPCFEQEPP